MSRGIEAVTRPAGETINEERTAAGRLASAVAWTAAVISIGLTTVDLWLAGQTRVTALTASTDLTIVGTAAIGAVIVSRRPSNAVGWLLWGIGVSGGLSQFTWSYGYYGVTVSGWPLSLQLLWLGEWIWLLPLGIALPALIVRLPDGRVKSGMKFVDWLAIAGTAALVVATAFMPGVVDPRATVPNPFGVTGAAGTLTALLWAGYIAVGSAVVIALSALARRLRSSRGDEREQIKWIATSGAVMTAGVLYGFARRAFGGENLYDALLPFLISTVTLPVAIGVAVLKYRLYDIDLLINRALVYGSLTAGLAGLYAVSLSLAQQLVGAAGQRSGAAILITAFIGSTAFTPAKGWLQQTVDTRFSVRDPVVSLDSLRAQVEVVAQVLDAQRIARRLVDDLAASYRSRFVLLSLKSDQQMIPFYSAGDPSAAVALTIPLHSDGREVGVLSLGERHGGLSYRPRDHEALQLCADAVGDVIGLWRNMQARAERMGLQPEA